MSHMMSILWCLNKSCIDYYHILSSSSLFLTTYLRQEPAVTCSVSNVERVAMGSIFELQVKSNSPITKNYS